MVNHDQPDSPDQAGNTPPSERESSTSNTESGTHPMSQLRQQPQGQSSPGQYPPYSPNSSSPLNGPSPHIPHPVSSPYYSHVPRPAYPMPPARMQQTNSTYLAYPAPSPAQYTPYPPSRPDESPRSGSTSPTDSGGSKRKRQTTHPSSNKPLPHPINTSENTARSRAPSTPDSPETASPGGTAAAAAAAAAAAQANKRTKTQRACDPCRRKKIRFVPVRSVICPSSFP